MQASKTRLERQVTELEAEVEAAKAKAREAAAAAEARASTAVACSKAFWFVATMCASRFAFACAKLLGLAPEGP